MSRDFTPREFREWGNACVERLARYFETVEARPVLARTKPGEVLRALPPGAPEEPESWDAIERDLDALIEPNMTHWQHPGYFAYFANSGSVPGVLGDFLAAGYNQTGILWRTSPVLTELEQGTVGWLRDLVGLPPSFDGQLADTASSATLIALTAAREQAFPDVRKTGLAGRPRGVVYASELAHSSIHKACVVLGLGLDGLSLIPTDEEFRMDPRLLEKAIARDRALGHVPIAVVACAGTTSVSSVDPLSAIADLCERESLWLHVDAAYAGSAAVLPAVRPLFTGWERADSVVFNPHKWMFVPLECTALLFRGMERVRRAFSVVPTYLETPEGAGGADSVREYMDYGIQLGRRFRSLKMWMTLRLFGARGVRERIQHHLDLTQRLAAGLAGDEGFRLVAPVPFSLVVFRATAPGLSPEAEDGLNRRILETLNEEGRSFVSHTVLRGRYVLRAAIGSLRTEEEHVDRLLHDLKSARREHLARRS